MKALLKTSALLGLVTACGANTQIPTIPVQIITPDPTPSEATISAPVAKSAKAISTMSAPIPDGTNTFYTLNLNAKTDLPECSDLNEGTLAYVKDEKSFYACSSFEWSTIDINGSNGADGKDAKQIGIAVTIADSTKCANGGYIFKNYYDENKNGIFDSTEQLITESTVCNGQKGDIGTTGIAGSTGTAGATGSDLGTIVSNTSANACPTGGKHIKLFKDLNKNGTLESDETITSELDLCNGNDGSNGSNAITNKIVKRYTCADSTDTAGWDYIANLSEVHSVSLIVDIDSLGQHYVKSSISSLSTAANDFVIYPKCDGTISGCQGVVVAGTAKGDIEYGFHPGSGQLTLNKTSNTMNAVLYDQDISTTSNVSKNNISCTVTTF